MSYDTLVQQYYVGFYGRAADKEGLDFWTAKVTEADGDFSVIQDAFAASQEYEDFVLTDDTGRQRTNEELVNFIYNNLFGRDAEAEGLEHYVDGLEDGTYTEISIVKNVIDGLEVNSDDYLTFHNRVEAADYFTDNLGNRAYQAEDILDVRSLLAYVDETRDSVTAAKQAADRWVKDQPFEPGFEGATVTLQAIPPEVGQETTLMWDVINAESALKFFADFGNLDLVDLGLIDDSGNMLPGAIEKIEINDEGMIGFATGYSTASSSEEAQVVYTTEHDVDIEYLAFLTNLLFTADHQVLAGEVVTSYIPRLWENIDTTINFQGLVLTPNENNGGTFGYIDGAHGNTSELNDLIVAGRPELLHGAYIDGGGGYNTLEVNMKGPFAQPYQLLNIQQVNVQNLPNIYDDFWAVPGNTDDYPGWIGDGDYDGGYGSTTVNFGFPLPEFDFGLNSVLDLSNARQLQQIVVTEGWSNSGELGSLTLVGIRNNATVRLEGGFEEDVYLHYGEGLGAAVNLELNVGDVLGTIYVAHNTNTLNIHSIKGENWLADGWFGGTLTQLNITGEAALYIEGALTSSFHANRTANIDAGGNTGGVDLLISHEDVEFIGSRGDDKFTVEEADIVNITGGAGDNVYVVYADGPSEVVNITGGNGNDQFVVEAAQINISAGSGNNAFMLAGTDDDAVMGGYHDWMQGGSVDNGALLNIDTGAGSNTIILGVVDPATGAWNGLTAMHGSVIAGDNISLFVRADSDLSHADLAGTVNSVSIHTEADLLITQDQFSDLGADLFSGYQGAMVNLHVIISQNTTLSELVDLADLNPEVKLHFFIEKGATLTMDAEELHKYLAEDGITMGNDPDNGESMGKVVINNAGNNFNPFAVADVDDPEIGYGLGGTIDGWGDGINIIVNRTADGYERPSADEYYDPMILDSSDGALTIDANGFVDDGEFNVMQADALVMVGANDITFTAPVAFEAENFAIDFYSLIGNLLGGGDLDYFTIADFENITAAADTDDWGKIVGNGLDVRINVELGAENAAVGAAGIENGLKSSGVATYVVTAVDGSASFFVCTSTRDLETLGLQGNYSDSIHFQQVESYVGFLMEGSYHKSYGNADQTYVGTLQATFMHEGADAVVTVNNQGVALGDDMQLVVAGINIDNADSLTVNISDGDTVIESLALNDITDITITSANDVTVVIDGDGNDWSDLESFDATGVAGTMTLDIENEVDLSGADVSGVDTMALAADSELTLNLDQFGEIDLVAGFDPDEDNAELNLVGLAEQAFSLGLLAEGIDLVSLEVAALPEVTLHADTDLTGVEQLIVPAGTTLNLTAAQYNQLEGDANTDNKIIVEGDAADGTLGSVNITDLSQEDALFTDADGNAAALDLSLIVDGNDDPVGGTLTLVESIEFGEREFGAEINGVDLGAFAIILGEDQSVTFTNPDQAHERVITGDGANEVYFWFANVGGNEVTYERTGAADYTAAGLNLSGYTGLAQLHVWSTLVGGENVEEILALLTDDNIIHIHEPPVEEQALTHREVVVEPGTTIDGGLEFEDMREPWAIETLNLTLLGDVDTGNLTIMGGVDRPDGEDSNAFKTLTINSMGDDPNEMGDISATDNNLLNVEIYAWQDLEINSLELRSEDVEEAEAVLSVTTGEDVTLTLTNVSTETTAGAAATITLAISHEGDGELLIPGDDDAGLDLGDATTLVLTGDGNITFGDSEDDANTAGITGTDITSINAEGLTGDLDLGEVTGLAETEFFFVSGTGQTMMVLDGATLDIDGDDDEPGWSFDFSSAAAGSMFVIADTNIWTDGALNIALGANTTLYIDDDAVIDWSALDLSITGDQDIVLGEGVQLTLTAAQAHNLNIVPHEDIILDENDPDYDPLAVPQVNIINLGTAAYDLSGIDADIAGNVWLAIDDPAVDPNAADVTLNENTDLGAFTVMLLGLGDTFGDGQTIRFQNEDQAARAIEVTDVDDPGTDGTNVVWLFDEVIGPVDTSGYSDAIGRLWLRDQLVDGQNVENLFTRLDDTILRIEYTGVIPLALDQVEGFDRNVEVVAFTVLANGLIFSDLDGLMFVENLNIELGGEVDLGDLTIDNVVGVDADNPEDAVFQKLTIDSLRANDADPDRVHLLPDDWDEDEHRLPYADEPNVVGDISGGAGHILLEIELNAEDVDLDVGTITFDGASGAAGRTTLTVNGANTTTVAAIDLTDPSLTEDIDPNPANEVWVNDFLINGDGTLEVEGAITFGSVEDEVSAVLEINGTVSVTAKTLTTGGIETLTVTNNSTGAVNITGGSQALIGDADLEGITLAGINGGGITIGSRGVDDDDQPFSWGIAAANLDSIAAGGTNNDITLVLEQINGDDFTFTGGTGVNTVTLGSVRLNEFDDDEPLDTPGWTFNMGAQADATLTITAAANFNNAGVLTVNMANGTLIIDGNVDLRGVEFLNLTVDTIEILEGSTLSVTAADISGINLEGDGNLLVVDVGGTAGQTFDVGTLDGRATFRFDDSPVTAAGAVNITGFSAGNDADDNVLDVLSFRAFLGVNYDYAGEFAPADTDEVNIDGEVAFFEGDVTAAHFGAGAAFDDFNEGEAVVVCNTGNVYFVYSEDVDPLEAGDINLVGTVDYVYDDMVAGNVAA